MSQPSEIVEQRFHARLSEGWRRWFDEQVAIVLPGEFRQPGNIAEVSETPEIMWPGLMQPDTLPVLSNAYGDWLCVRVNAAGEFAELIHWYHGGGDWIPVGRSLQEAILHDWVDQLRPRSTQMLRGAEESLGAGRILESGSSTLQSSAESVLGKEARQWLASGLGLNTQQRSVAEVVEVVDQVCSLHETREYERALDVMRTNGWAEEAVICDQIDIQLRRIGADFSIDQVNDLPNSSAATESDLEPKQWHAIVEICEGLVTKRNDLAWPNDILGWAHFALGNQALAYTCWSNSLTAASYSDQSVRLGTHLSSSTSLKVAAAFRCQLERQATVPERGDGSTTRELESYFNFEEYESLLRANNSQASRSAVSQFWLAAAERAKAAGDWAATYECYFRAGWDVGVGKLLDYEVILDGLCVAASNAAWPARKAIAELHRRSFKSRYSSRR